MNDLIIDNEFKELLPPLSDEKYKQLEKNLLRDGIREPLTVWNGILIDGHNRYNIARLHNLEFTTVEMAFDSRDAVKIWIADNQFGRRDLTVYERSLLAIKIKPSIAVLAKERQGERNDLNIVKNSCQSSEEPAPVSKSKSARENKTDYQVAQKAGVSEDTIRKVERIEQQATPEIKAALKSGDLSINAAYEGIKSGAVTVEEVKQAKKPHVYFNNGNNEWYTPKTFIDAAREVLGTIDLDPASSEIANETVQATKFYTAEDDGLAHEWHGNIWLNPPYSTGLIEKFADKLIHSDYQQAIVLVNNATDTCWFAQFANAASAVVFPKGRVKFYKPDGSTGAPLQGQAILYFGKYVEKFKANFEQFGRCWQ